MFVKQTTAMFSPENTTEFGYEPRLRPGDIVEFDGDKIVVMVDTCRAKLAACSKKSVVFTDSRTGKDINFTSIGSETISISPNSEVPIKRRLGKAGLEFWQKNKRLPI
jgi:hypothetical protein